MPSIIHEIKIAHPPNTDQSGEAPTSSAADRSQAILKHGKKQLRYSNLFLGNGRTLISISLGVIATQPFQMSLEVFWQKKSETDCRLQSSLCEKV